MVSGGIEGGPGVGKAGLGSTEGLMSGLGFSAEKWTEKEDLQRGTIGYSQIRSGFRHRKILGLDASENDMLRPCL